MQTMFRKMREVFGFVTKVVYILIQNEMQRKHISFPKRYSYLYSKQIFIFLKANARNNNILSDENLKQTKGKFQVYFTQCFI